MIIPIEGLPKNYLVLEGPKGKGFVLVFQPPEGQRLREVKSFDTLPTLEAITEAITDWDCAIAGAKR